MSFCLHVFGNVGPNFAQYVEQNAEVVAQARDGNGIGVAADLTPMELERIRLTPADELYLTEDTAQIVVRTAANTPR